MNNILRISLSLLVILFITNAAVNAQSLKIGYANPDKIIDQLPSFKKVQQNMQNLVQEKEASLLGKRDTLAAGFQKYQELSATMSATQREEEEARLQTMNEELQEMSNSVRVEMQRKQAEMLQPLYEEVQKAIDEVAKELKLDFVFNSITSAGDAIILFADDTEKSKLDITDKVIAKITKK